MVENKENVQKCAHSKKVKIELRRMRIAELVAQGLSDIEIAESLNVHRNTVRKDRIANSNTFEKKFAEFNINSLMEKTSNEYENQKREAWSLMENARTPSEKVKILIFIKSLTDSYVELPHRLGIIKPGLGGKLILENQSTNEISVYKTLLEIRRKEKEKQMEEEKRNSKTDNSPFD